jgi:hypothetical protein
LRIEGTATRTLVMKLWKINVSSSTESCSLNMGSSLDFWTEIGGVLRSCLFASFSFSCVLSFVEGFSTVRSKTKGLLCLTRFIFKH